LPPFIIEPDALYALMQSDEILLIDLSSLATYESHHLQGAVHVLPQEIISGSKPAPGKLPDIDRLNQLFSKIGYSPNKHIVAYDDEGGGWAGRFLWTLDVIGHEKMSYLNGGIHAWLASDLPTTVESNLIEATKCNLTLNLKFNASQNEVAESLEDDNSVIWDARSLEEHLGTKAFSARAGRIPGAIHFEWTQAMDPARQLRIREDISEILTKLGITKNKKIITYCQTHHRSGFTYIIGKSLGYDIRAYDGSWSEWGNDPNTPIEQG
jgi:thiosulfate/3-mercaptopyruvate sulfurtransferase